MRIRSFWLTDTLGTVPTTSPSRSTVMRSAISKTSSRRWEMYSTSVFSAFSRRMREKRRASSSLESTAEGSSRMRILGFSASALAISTTCWWDTLSRETRVRASSAVNPRPLRIVRAWERAWRQWTQRPPLFGSLPHEDVLRDGQVRHEAELLVDGPNAQPVRLVGSAHCHGRCRRSRSCRSPE